MYFLPLALFFDGIRHMFALMTNRCGVISWQSHARIFTIRRGAADCGILPSLGIGVDKYFLNRRLLQNHLGYVIICIYYSAYGMCRPLCPLYLSGPVCRFRSRTLARRVRFDRYHLTIPFNDPVRASLSVGSVCRSHLPDPFRLRAHKPLRSA